MAQRRIGLRLDGKLKKGYRYNGNGQVVKSKAKICKEKVGQKIGITMKEYKKGKTFSSPEQAIAVGFKIAIKENPQCKKDLLKTIK